MKSWPGQQAIATAVPEGIGDTTSVMAIVHCGNAYILNNLKEIYYSGITLGRRVHPSILQSLQYYNAQVNKGWAHCQTLLD